MWLFSTRCFRGTCFAFIAVKRKKVVRDSSSCRPCNNESLKKQEEMRRRGFFESHPTYLCFFWRKRVLWRRFLPTMDQGQSRSIIHSSTAVEETLLGESFNIFDSVFLWQRLSLNSRSDSKCAWIGGSRQSTQNPQLFAFVQREMLSVHLTPVCNER